MSTSLNSSNCLTGRKHERVTDCVFLDSRMQDSVLKIITTVHNRVGRVTEILWHRTCVAGSIPDGDMKYFFIIW